METGGSCHPFILTLSSVPLESGAHLDVYMCGWLTLQKPQ